VPKFTIRGVDKDSRFDTNLIVEADTEGNARVKAELQGIVVTEVVELDELQGEPDEGSGMGLSRPPALPQGKGDKEKTIWTGYPSKFYYLGNYILAAVLVLGGIFALSTPGTDAVLVGGFVALVMGVITLIFAILDQKTRVYTVTSKMVMSKEGIISRTTSEINLSDIRNINMKQRVLERIFGLGTVAIGSAGTGELEVAFKGVRNPAQVRDRIRDSKDQFA
jgi:membrane protein YdbS with pleckstrin-like domain